MLLDAHQLLPVFIVFLCVGALLFCFMEMASCRGKVIAPLLVVILGLAIFGQTNGGLLEAVKMAAIALVGGWGSCFVFFWLRDMAADRLHRIDEQNSAYGRAWDLGGASGASGASSASSALGASVASFAWDLSNDWDLGGDSGDSGDWDWD